MANLSNFAGAVLMNQSSGQFEPQRKSNFALILDSVDDSLGSLILSIKTTDVPGVAFTKGSVKYFNETIKYAGSVAPFADQQIVFHDYVDRPTFELLSKWSGKVWNPASGAMGWAADYKVNGSIYLLPPGVQGSVGSVVSATNALNNRVWKLYGCFPLTFKHDGLDMADDGSSPLSINLTLSIDRCVPAPMTA